MFLNYSIHHDNSRGKMFTPSPSSLSTLLSSSSVTILYPLSGRPETKVCQVGTSGTGTVEGDGKRSLSLSPDSGLYLLPDPLHPSLPGVLFAHTLPESEGQPLKPTGEDPESRRLEERVRESVSRRVSWDGIPHCGVDRPETSSSRHGSSRHT